MHVVGGRTRALKRSLAVLAATVTVAAAAVAGAQSALAAPTPGATASPTSINPGDTSTVALTLQGETSVQSTPTDLVLVLDESGSISASDFSTLKSFANSVVTAVRGGARLFHGPPPRRFCPLGPDAMNTYAGKSPAQALPLPSPTGNHRDGRPSPCKKR